MANGPGLVHAGCGEAFSHKQCCGDYRIGDQLQIKRWQSTKSGEIKTSRRHPAGVHFENLESDLRNDGYSKRWGHVFEPSKHMIRI